MRPFFGFVLTLFSIFLFSQSTKQNVNKIDITPQKQSSANKLKINSNNIYKDNNLSLLIPKKKNGKFGYINREKTVVIPYEFSSATFFTEDCNLLNSPDLKVRKFGSRNYATVEKNGKQFRINKKGQLVYQLKEADLGNCKSVYQKKRFNAYILNGLYGVIEKEVFGNPEDSSQYRIYPQYDYLFILEGNKPDSPMIIATKNNRFGILDINGKIIVPFEYSDIKRNYSYKQAELFEVTKDDINYFYIDIYNKAY